MMRLAVFASGEGSNFEAIVQACSDGRLDAQVVLMVCDRPGAPVVQKAALRGVESFVFSPREYACKADYETQILSRLKALDVDLICLAGYMRIVSEVLLRAYEGRILNIHPSLLPAFKGARAVEQALEYGVKVFGVTVHYVSAELDSGKIIAQRAFEYEGDSAQQVHALGQIIEHTLYPEAIQKVINELKQ